MKKFIPLLLFIGLSAWSPSLETVGRVDRYQGGGGTLLFSPLSQNDDKLFFTQAQLGLFHHLFTGTAGFGYRQKEIFCAWGVNAFCDLAHARSRSLYYQLGAGVELFGGYWLLRGNSYLPFRNRHQLSFRHIYDVQIRGTTLVATDQAFETLEQGYTGFDGEVGYGLRLPFGQLWAFAGGFYFQAGRVKNFASPRLRVEYTLEALPIEIVAGTSWERHALSCHLSLRLPLYPRHGESLSRQMGHPIHRRSTIWVEREEITAN